MYYNKQTEIKKFLNNLLAKNVNACKDHDNDEKQIIIVEEIISPKYEHIESIPSSIKPEKEILQQPSQPLYIEPEKENLHVEEKLLPQKDNLEIKEKSPLIQHSSSPPHVEDKLIEETINVYIEEPIKLFKCNWNYDMSLEKYIKKCHNHDFECFASLSLKYFNSTKELQEYIISFRDLLIGEMYIIFTKTCQILNIKLSDLERKELILLVENEIYKNNIYLKYYIYDIATVSVLLNDNYIYGKYKINLPFINKLYKEKEVILNVSQLFIENHTLPSQHNIKRFLEKEIKIEINIIALIMFKSFYEVVSESIYQKDNIPLIDIQCDFDDHNQNKDNLISMSGGYFACDKSISMNKKDLKKECSYCKKNIYDDLYKSSIYITPIYKNAIHVIFCSSDCMNKTKFNKKSILLSCYAPISRT